MGTAMHFPRSSGILLHITSLPSRWGIGDLGGGAYQFVDFLEAAGQQLWQIMPVGPTGYGDSPYQATSAFAGNPLLISFDLLRDKGLLTNEDLADAPAFPDHAVDYGAVITYKNALLRRSFEHFSTQANAEQQRALEQFRATNSGWLDDYALFTALKNHHDGAGWNSWERDIATHQANATARWREQLADEVAYQVYVQHLFFKQWRDLKAYANSKSISIVGDAPIFVAYDSADVWANSDLFYLDEAGNPTVVAGVPPDYFSATGQRWGNPLYRWDVMARDGYAWWIRRLRAQLTLVDILRLDHFRGFEAYWEVPADEETAINGRWVKTPGADLFEHVQQALGSLPLIAEDLGMITPEVEELRDAFGLPGMKVLQFAFGDDAENVYLPHNYTNPNCVVYTGTHDNDTTVGWFHSRDDKERQAVQHYLGRDGSDIAWDLMRVAFASIADIAIVPLADVLRLGSEARMNIPGAPSGNWSWRYHPDQLRPGLDSGLRDMVATYGRIVVSNPERLSEKVG